MENYRRNRSEEKEVLLMQR